MLSAPDEYAMFESYLRMCVALGFRLVGKYILRIGADEDELRIDLFAIHAPSSLALSRSLWL